MSEPPPSRYRVVERGRRLEVIDTRAAAASRSAPSAEPTHAPSVGRARFWPRRTRFDGTMEVVTHRLYDAKAPRTVVLDPALAARFEWAKGAALVGAFAFAAGVAAFPWLFAAPIAVHALGATSPLRKWEDRRDRRAELKPALTLRRSGEG